MSYNRRWLKTLAKPQFAQPPRSPSPVFPTISKQGPSFSISQLGWRPQSEVPSLFMQMSSDFDGVITNIFGKLLLWMRNIHPGQIWKTSARVRMRRKHSPLHFQIAHNLRQKRRGWILNDLHKWVEFGSRRLHSWLQAGWLEKKTLSQSLGW